MSIPDYSDYVRVVDEDINREGSIPRSAVPHGNYREVEGDALSLTGDPLPWIDVAKPLSKKSGQQAEPKKESNNG